MRLLGVCAGARSAQRPLRLSRETREMQGEFAANARKGQDGIAAPTGSTRRAWREERLLRSLAGLKPGHYNDIWG
jgi:hypothetical protein